MLGYSIAEAPIGGAPQSGGEAATQVFADLSGGYSIAALVSADLTGSYSIASAVTLVSADLVGSYGIAGLVSADLSGAYGIAAFVHADFTGNFAIESDLGQIMTFSASAARTVTVNAGLKPFTAGDLWNMADPKKPRSGKDSDSTVDYSFNWTPWLLDVVDSIVSHEIVLTEGLTNAGSTVVGSVVTVFVAAGTPSKRASLTCRITTASTPPRSEDRTLYLDIEAA